MTSSSWFFLDGHSSKLWPHMYYLAIGLKVIAAFLANWIFLGIPKNRYKNDEIIIVWKVGKTQNNLWEKFIVCLSVHSFSFVGSLICWFVGSFIGSLIRSLVHWFVCSFVRSFVQFIQHSFIHTAKICVLTLEDETLNGSKCMSLKEMSFGSPIKVNTVKYQTAELYEVHNCQNTSIL